ncbi:MAG: trimethylamine methyltransferase family protein [Pseudomonadota bacterium]
MTRGTFDEGFLRTLDSAACRLLAERGMSLPSPEAAGALCELGATLDEASGTCRIPAEVLAALLARAPRAFTLHGRDPEHDLSLGSGRCYVTNDGTGTEVLDAGAETPRPSTLEDLRRATILSELLPSVMVSGPMVTAPSDGPSANLRDIALCLRLCRKHIQHEVDDDAEARALVRLLEVAADDAGRPGCSQLSAVYCPHSPLRHPAGVLDGLVTLARARVPLMVLPMPIMGASAPTSLAATAVQAHAEALCSVALIQALAPGLPVIYGVGAGAMDHRTAAFSGAGPAPVALTELLIGLGRLRSLPTCAQGFVSDAAQPGPRAVFEKAAGGEAAVAAGADLVYGIGMLGASTVLSFEQLMIDDEIATRALWRQDRRAQLSVEESEDSVLEAITRSQDGRYFRNRDMLRRFKRDSYSAAPHWEAHQGHEEWAEAHARVERAIASWAPVDLSPVALAEVQRILRASAAEGGPGAGPAASL